MVFRLLLLLALSCAVHAQTFQPSDIFGDAWSGDAAQGKLSLPLRQAPLPGFVDVAGSGDGSALSAVSPAQTGIAVAPGAAHGTVQLGIDLGATSATAEITLAELDQGGRVAWHLRALGQGGDYVAEVARGEKGFSLAIRVRNRDRYTTVPGATAQCEAKLPASLSLALKSDGLTLTFAGTSVIAAAELPEGATFAVAVTDQRARFHSLVIEALLAPAWVQDAHARVQARRALERLREFATAGLLEGIAGQPYPDRDQWLAAYSAEQAQARAKHDAASLAGLATELPDNPLANHEAGVAALLAGMPHKGLPWLKRAHELKPAPLTGLALAEALRRTAQLGPARKALDAARKQLPPALAADAVLIEARLLADNGELAQAHQLLSAAIEKYPDHAQLAAFAESARMLTQPQTLRASTVPGPLGLSLISDLPDHTLRQLSSRLEPYLAVLRDWLPALPRTLTGRVAVFAGPVEYLSAALLVAGDNLDNVAGMYIPRGLGGQPMILACRAFGEDELVRTLVHELWHLCVRACGHEPPRWLDEGIAVYLSAGRPEQGRMAYDAWPVELADDATAPDAESLARAFAASGAEFYQPADVRGNYRAAWAAVLLHAQETAGRERLRKAVAGNAEALQALAADAKATEAALGGLLKGLRR